MHVDKHIVLNSNRRPSFLNFTFNPQIIVLPMFMFYIHLSWLITILKNTSAETLKILPKIKVQMICYILPTDDAC
jgi:hypothetical protein